jgi:hypothetical protein
MAVISFTLFNYFFLLTYPAEFNVGVDRRNCSHVSSYGRNGICVLRTQTSL